MIANWTLSADIGSEISEDCEDLSILLQNVMEKKEISEELLLCVISTLNNLSFYKHFNSIGNTVDENSHKTALCKKNCTIFYASC